MRLSTQTFRRIAQFFVRSLVVRDDGRGSNAQENRFSNLKALRPEERLEYLRRVTQGLSDRRPMNEAEVRSVYEALIVETLPAARHFEWACLTWSPRYPPAVEYAKEQLADTRSATRDGAAQYLLEHVDDAMTLARQLVGDSDAGVRFSAAWRLLRDDRRTAMHVFMDLAVDESVEHDVYDGVEETIIREGDRDDLDELRRRDSDLGGSSRFGELASALERRISNVEG